VSPRGGERAKAYDASYYEKWYRKSRVGVGHKDFVERKVRLALAAAEYVLGRPVQSVLDVGCGEAPWRALLRRARKKLEYEGVDSSEYAVSRYGAKRNIRRGSLGELGFMGLQGPYDLIVCADVLHYVRSPEVRQGLAAIASRLGGVAFVEAFTSADDIEGDRDQFQNRTPAVYRHFFSEAGLVPVGLHLYVTREVHATLVALEQGGS
jgi:2-polyprenyl-3-methyl-5-hydroxy-6-metoxy-1,4-benzoquinol methylase